MAGDFTLDFWIVGAYLFGLLIVGAYFARQAGRSGEDYFLGGRKLPWWALGASGMSSNLDVAGTMTIITLLFVFGLHGFFIEMRGGVVLPIAVFLAFMGKWHYRSQVMTTAEWMALRFGTARQGKAARITAAVTYVIITIGMVVFFLAAAGKFLATFLPFTEFQCQIGMLLVALIYTAMSGLYGVVWTDVIQAFLIGTAAIYVAVLGSMEVSPELLAQWPGASLNNILPSFYNETLVSGETGGAMDYRWFGLFFITWIGKGLLEGLGGSGGSAYMAQRFYAAGSERDCIRIGILWTLLFAFRWPMVMGFALMAISLGIGSENPEVILPEVLKSDFFQPGIRGLIIAAMLAAAMSTFDSTINAGAAYIVNDIYEPLCVAESETTRETTKVRAGYLASTLIVFSGLGLSQLTTSIVDVWVLIVTALFPAFLVPFALRWFWSRFNGAGFTLGVIGGFLGVLGCTTLGTGELETMLFITLSSGIFCLAGTYLAAPTPEATLTTFCKQVRPLGWWPQDLFDEQTKEEHTFDKLTLVVAVLWQISTFLLPLTLVLHLWVQAGALLIVWTPCSIYLYRRAFSQSTTSESS